MEKIKLVVATHNRHKFEEIAALMPSGVELKPYWELSGEEIPETGDTLTENARQKSAYVREHFSADCFADDTGLEVEALDGAPGVYSARYAGPGATYQDNVDKLLQAMAGVQDRRARFVTLISLWLHGREYLFEGSVEGTILESPQGEDGFGYDPVFLPQGCDRSFAQMTLEEKGRISHRARATEAMIAFLSEYLKTHTDDK